jgi:hypothetical protein
MKKISGKARMRSRPFKNKRTAGKKRDTSYSKPSQQRFSRSVIVI